MERAQSSDGMKQIMVKHKYPFEDTGKASGTAAEKRGLSRVSDASPRWETQARRVLLPREGGGKSLVRCKSLMGNTCKARQMTREEAQAGPSSRAKVRTQARQHGPLTERRPGQGQAGPRCEQGTASPDTEGPARERYPW